ncbi:MULTISPECIES: ABC transporter substrate-binding protein [Prauserella salsuginis group]|uniref:ABC transporter substrate-binding protein n=2 Tax=Prauserella salsuginis group TaxID=2893672 RepID=A0ABW6G4J5_9PSEU|nr:MULTISPECIES: ABC transporter substrate-binding protein [Prauserella salsuginis group]MCR3718128.1 peptide/nickel transport system substrate-binding protein [Prauserella flava]MCR3732698.1 peptide/nickel transport system substrate-binding protein [Prauserella salsuginis]
MRFARSRRGRAVSAALLTPLLVAGPFTPAAGAQETGDGEKSVLRVALVQEIDHLNPFTASFASSTMIGRMTWEFMTPPSAEDATPSPGVASEWESSEDGLTWTYTINPDVKWSDGEDVTSEDVKFTFEKIMNDPVAAEANGSYVENFEKVTTPDEDTVQVRTSEPQASMTALDIPIVPEHIWSDVADFSAPKTDTLEYVGVGSGPFVISDYQPNRFVKLEANDRFWRSDVAVDELQFIQYENADAAVSALQSGEVDFVNRLTPAQFETLEGSDGVATNSANGRRFSELMINPGAENQDGESIGDGHPALRKQQVRQAIAYAIDPKTLVDRVLGGYGQLPGGLVPAIYETFHYEPSEEDRYTYDPDRANRMLDEAGYEKGPDGVRRDENGRPLELRLTGRSSEDFDVRAADFIAGWLGDVGIRVTKNLVSDNQVDEQTTAANYDLALSGWGTNPDPDYILAKQTCDALPTSEGNSTSSAFYCDPAYDKLYRQQLAEMDTDKRAEIVKQAQELYYKAAPSVIIGYEQALEAYRSDRWDGFPRQPKGEGVIMEQTGYWGFAGARPVDGGQSGGMPTGAWVAIGAVALIVLAGGGTMLARRKGSVDDRE